jgi:hypothetical protein
MGIEQKNQKKVSFSLSSSRRCDPIELLDLLTSRSSPPMAMGVIHGIRYDDLWHDVALLWASLIFGFDQRRFYPSEWWISALFISV